MNSEAKTPKWKPEGKPTYHRDGSVSYFDIRSQGWERRNARKIAASGEAMDSFSDHERSRVLKVAARSN